jgi:tetratricopeptide (TPR) repeat protein
VLCGARATGGEPEHILDTIVSLLDKSLLQQTEQDTEESRLRMLETIREFGLECLHDAGEIEACREAHALYFLSLAEDAESLLKGTQQVEWLRRLEAEQGNIRAALRWLIENKMADLALRFTGALWRFWFMRGYFGEGRQWLQAALELVPRREENSMRAKALCGLGWINSFIGDIDAARIALEESATIFRQLGDKAGQAEAQSELAEGVYLRDDVAAARRLFEDSLELAREADEPWILSMVLRTLGVFIYEHDPADSERAETLLYECITLAQEELAETTHGKHHIARALLTLGEISLHRGEVEQAVTMLVKSLALLRDISRDGGRGSEDMTLALASLGEA